MHGHLVGQRLTREVLVVNLHNFVAGNHTGTLGRSVADDLLHAKCVLTDNELNTYTRKRAAQVVVGHLYVLG